MKNALVGRGIPADAVIKDHAGYRTWDSLWRCRGSFGSHTITVVSQRFHIERAIFIGHKQSLNIIGLTAQDPDGRLAARMFVRECLARVKCILDCYLFHPRPVYMRRIYNRNKSGKQR
jgi:SanA protein